MNKPLLNNLTEYQKSLLTRLSYIDINLNQFQDLQQTQPRITISDLKSLLSSPNEPYLGCLHSPQLKRWVTGVTTTSLEFIEKLEDAGLGDLEIIDLANDKNSGFNAICFRDTYQNTGFSFRGTDVKTFSSLAADSLADIEAFLTNNTEQINQAQIFFNKHKNPASQNFLYGHSLGGFLAENVYIQNYPNITNTFVINPLHINSALLDTPIKVAIFNNPAKFHCFITGGDYVSTINTPELFASNIRYIRNNGKYANNLIKNHLVECGEIINGNFDVCSFEEAYKGREIPIARTIISTINNNQVKEFFSKAFSKAKDWFLSTRFHLTNLFRKRKKTDKTTKQHIKSPPNTPKPPDNLEKRLNLNNYVGPNYSQEALKEAQKTITSRDSKKPLTS